MRIPINKGWLPDFVPFDMPEGGLTKCQNLLPLDEFYYPAKGALDYSTDAISGELRSGVEVKPATNANKWTFIGTKTKIFRLDQDKGLTEVTRTTPAYATGDNQWNWALYGDWIIGTDYADVPQVLKNIPTGTNFVALTGAPNAKYVLFYNGHLIFGYTNESATAYPKRLRWSAFESLEDYTPSLSTLSGYQDLQDADGDMTGLARIGSSFGIFFENSVTIGWYSGYPYAFGYAINKFPNTGAIPGTIVSVGDKCYWWSRHGMHVCTESAISDIGIGVRRTVLGSLNRAYYHRITSYHDVNNGLIYWCYPTSASSTGAPNKVLVYNYRTNIFTQLDISIGAVFGMTGGAVLLDDMPYASVEDIPYHLDSAYWLSGVPMVGCLSSTYLQTLTGYALTGTIETGDIKDATEGRSIQIQNVRPMLLNPSTESVSVRIGYRDKISDSIAYSQSAPMQTSGRCLVRNVGKMVRVEMTTGANDGIASYVEADMAYVGER